MTGPLESHAGESLVLQCQDVTKSYFGVRVLAGVSFSLAPGRALGLIGENGAGKSTLMNILGGVTQPDGGRLSVCGTPYAPKSPTEARAHGIAFIHQELNLFPNLSIAENIFLTGFPHAKRVPPWARLLAPIDRRRNAALTRTLLASVDLDVSPDARVDTLCPGERQLVEIAKALAFDARIVIFDEPTTSLTARECERLFGLIERLKREGRSVIFISHALEDVRRLCEDVVVLRDGEVVGQGPREAYPLDRMVSLMVGRKLEQLFPHRGTTPTDEPVLEVKDLAQPGVVDGISFTLRRGEVLGIAGLMGAGRSELARILFGLEPAALGQVVLSGAPFGHRSPAACIARGMGFLTENRRDEGLLMDADVRENVSLAALPRFSARAGLLDGAALAAEVDAIALAVGIPASKLEGAAVKTLSGGNQQKVVLAKWLLTEPDVFILDEPTRGVDVGAKSEIYALINHLVGRGAGVLMISSELEELIGMCDRIVVMHKGTVTGEFRKESFQREEILRQAFGGGLS